ncbi:MAG: ribonuclease P protein component [Defluviitaleaceae bacterium]|nr:ribonuclease P protein component [Defluviitaleaceae bacterium]
MRFTVSLKKTVQFKAVYAGGRSCATELLVLYSLQNHTDGNRLGFSVSKKVGNSVVRNRVTRLIRENYRLAEENVKPGHDLVVIARKPAGGADFYEIRDSLLKLLKRQNVYISGENCYAQKSDPKRPEVL